MREHTRRHDATAAVVLCAQKNRTRRAVEGTGDKRMQFVQARAAQIIFTRDARVTGSHDSFSILFLNLWLDFVALFIFFY